MSEFKDMLSALDGSTMVTITDADGKLLYVNQLFCDVTKYSKEELIGAKPHELLNSGFHDQAFHDDVWNTLKNGNAWKGDVKNKAKDGSFFWTLTTIMPFLDDNDKPYKFIAIRRDITAKVEADERLKEKTHQLEKANKELQKQTQRAEHLSKIGELASNLTHNLRNPVGVISSTVKIIEATSKDSLDEKMLARLSRITDSTTNISNQIEDVLNFVKNKPLDLEMILLSKILQAAINNIEIPERVNIHLPENDISLECDPPKLEVVFMNLITNAIQAIEDQGDVFIRVNTDSDFITIDVENSGPEIPPDVLPKIFDSLFTTKASGTGLGLAFCKNSIEQHKGTMSASNNPTTFTIKIRKTQN